MGLSILELRRVLVALSPLSGAYLQEVFQPTPTELVLELRAQKESLLLLLSLHPRLSRIHPIARRPHNPLQPHAFQMICRKELSGRLTALTLEGDDRIIRLRWEGATQRSLLAELTDRHANLFLLDQEDRLLGMMIPPSLPRSKGNGARRAPHTSPTPPGDNPASEPSGVAEPPSHRPHRTLALGSPYLPPPPSPTPLRQTDRFSTLEEPAALLQGVAAYFEAELRRQAEQSLRTRLEAGLRRERKRLERRLEDLASDLEKASQAERHRHFGDVLQIYLRQVSRGHTFIVLPDPFSEDGETPLEIPLEPQLDGVGNLKRHYRLYRKYDASIPTVLARIEEAEAALRRLCELEAQLPEAGLEELQALEKEAALPARARAQAPKAASQAPGVRQPFVRYQNPLGQEIWVGRTDKDNDVLTFKVARGNDFWLHLRGRPGTHVVVPARTHTPDLETLLDAATLAMKHSGLKLGERAEVSYTRAKYVRRVPGDHPGLVTFSQDKTLFLELTEARLSRLVRVEPEG